MDIAVTLENRQLKPAVVNTFQYENEVITLNFTLDSYIYEETDLRNYTPFAITSQKGIVDITELEMNYDETDDVLTLSWDLGNYTLQEDGAITYQIVFKENADDNTLDSAAWYSYNAIIVNRGSVDADYKVVAEYPTLLTQWMGRMNNLHTEITDYKDETIAEINDTRADLEKYATDFTNSVFYIPWDETIPVEDRLDGRLYFQYTDAERTKGRFEDPEGVPLIAEAKGGSPLPMFAPIWSDHLYNDASYLRADTFSWHNSSIYITGYDKLLKEYNNEASVEETDESGITYKLSPNGFKIADASQEEAIIELYSENEKAWYYILDTENARFKLPREKKADGKYLYFFVGAYEREEGEVNLGVLTELANGQDLEEILGEIDSAKTAAVSDVETAKITAIGEISTATDTEIARMQASGADSLQAQIDNLKAELNTMLGRMDFANSEEFSVSTTKTYTVPSDGYVQFDHANSDSTNSYVTINGVNYCTLYAITSGNVSVIPVSIGDVFGINGSSGMATATFIPQKGV